MGVLEQLSEGINNSINRSIGIEPNKVTYKNRREIFDKLYSPRAPPPECKYVVGNVVRIPIKKTIFDKGYKPSWSKELYRISKKSNDGSVCYYRVETLNGDSVDRNFYEQELNLTIRNALPPSTQ